MVLGNAPVVRKTPDQNWGKQSDNIGAVVPRAQAKRNEESIKPLNMTQIDVPFVNASTPETSQREDSSLGKLWDLTQSREKIKTRGNQIYRYEARNSFYTGFMSKHGAQPHVK